MFHIYYNIKHTLANKWQYIWPCFIVLASVILIYYYKSITTNPTCCDAGGYGGLGGHIRAHGLFWYDMFGWRPYLYPFILSLFDSGITAYVNSTVFIYFLCYLLSLKLLSKANIKYKWLILSAFLSNPLLLMCMPFTITEGYILIIFTLLFAVITFTINKLYHDATRPYWLLTFIVIGGLAGAMIEIRPASIIILPCIIITLLWFSPSYMPYAKTNIVKHKLVYLPCMLLPITFGFFLIVWVQIAFNVKFYDSWSFLPAAPYGGTSLSNALMGAGMTLWKFATLHGNGLFYEAKDFVGDILVYRNNPLEFYFGTLKGWVMMLAHVYQSLNYDFLEIYITKNNYPIFSWYQILSSLITSLGIAGICIRLKNFKTQILPIPHHFFLLLAIAVTLALCAVISAETRYGMIAQMGLGYFALLFVLDDFKFISYKQRYASLSLVAIYCSLSVYASWWFIKTSVAVVPLTITWV